MSRAAQITGQMTAINAKVEISVDGTTWVDVSGAGSTLAPSGGARPVGEAYTFSGDNPLVGVGKSGPMDIQVTAVYNEDPSGLFMTLLPQWEDGDNMWLRWSPNGGNSGDLMFTAGPGKISAFPYPTLTANEGTPIMVGFTYHGPKPVVSAVA